MKMEKQSKVIYIYFKKLQILEKVSRIVPNDKKGKHESILAKINIRLMCWCSFWQTWLIRYYSQAKYSVRKDITTPLRNDQYAMGLYIVQIKYYDIRTRSLVKCFIVNSLYIRHQSSLKSIPSEYDQNILNLHYTLNTNISMHHSLWIVLELSS